jgi:quercetin dioxygenase-like cupin family protein
MIVHKSEAKKREFLGVDFVLLSHGPESMVTKMLYKTGDNPPLHEHPNEQSGYVISGKYRLIIEGVKHNLEAGDTYSIPKNVKHTMEIIESGEVIDVFCPPRPDYL